MVHPFKFYFSISEKCINASFNMMIHITPVKNTAKTKTLLKLAIQKSHNLSILQSKYHNNYNDAIVLCTTEEEKY